MEKAGKRRWGWGLMLVGFAIFYWMLVCTVIDTCGTNAELYSQLQQGNGLPEAAEITLEEMETIDQQLAQYLSGDAQVLEELPFQSHEKLHMEDVFALFEKLRFVRNLLFAAAIVLILSGWLLRREGALRACLWGLVPAVLPLLLFGIWAAVDFGGAFTAFHRALFRNDLWQLDAQTDLLLMLCPEGFFRDFAAVIALRTGLYAMAVPLALAGIRIGRNFV